jgi:hypothetical protein
MADVAAPSAPAAPAAQPVKTPAPGGKESTSAGSTPATVTLVKPGSDAVPPAGKPNPSEGRARDREVKFLPADQSVD